MSKKATLALDATEAARPQRTGIGIYSERLIGALAATAPVEWKNRLRVVLSFRPGPYARWARKGRWPEGFALAPLLDPCCASLPRGFSTD